MTSPLSGREAALDAAARRLIDASENSAPCAPVRDLLPDGGLEEGYAVQKLVQARTSAGRRHAGRKIGLTSEAVQRQMGVATPDLGVLYADMAFDDGQPIPHGLLMQPRIEAEVAFVLGADFPEHTVTPSDVIGAIDFVVAAIEVCDSRIADWDISLFDTVADNASSGVFVLGAERHSLGEARDLADLDDLRTCEMTVTSGGAVISSGTGEACMGHPVNAVAWLANAVAERGDPLRTGEIVLSGSLGPLVPARPGATYEANISGLGSVRAVFAPATQSDEK